MPSITDWLSADGNSLREYLSRNHPPATVEQIAEQWHWCTVSALIEGDFRGIEGHDVARMTRGALWPVLVRHASAEAKEGLPCPRTPMSALDLLWNNHGFITRGREIPKPFVLRGHVDGSSGGTRAILQLVLFGLATSFAPILAAHIAEAFRDGVGVGRGKQAWRIASIEITDDTDAGEISDPVDLAVLDLRSPLSLKRDGEVSRDMNGLLPSLIDRVEGLALWHGLRLDCDFGVLKTIARMVAIDDRDIEIGRWKRLSSRAERPIPMTDRRGRLVLYGALQDLAPFLLIGETTNVGRDTRHGHGWYSAEFFG